MTSNYYGDDYQYAESFPQDLGYANAQANARRTNGVSNTTFNSNDNPYADVVSASFKKSGFVAPNPSNYASQTSPQASLNAENKPRILLLGLRRSGKTSILKVVFHKMSPNETLFLETTSKITKSDISNSTFIQFQIWDFPGQYEITDNSNSIESGNIESILKKTGAIIFVIDTQDEYSDSLNQLHLVITKVLKVNPNIFIEVFIHKSDGLSDDIKIEKQRDIKEQVLKLLQTSFSTSDSFNSLSFYLTSIYDHSIYEAFSRVSQKLIPQLPTLENLLDILIANCRMEKAFLIDVVSKIYVATDSNPVDMQSYELASDMIDVVVDVSSIYGNSTSQAFPSSPKEDSISDAKSSTEKQNQIKNQYVQSDSSDDESQSIIKLNNGMVLYLREVNKYLALVCLLRADNFDKHVTMSLVTLGKDSKKPSKLRRVDKKREPKVVENVKTAMFIRGSQASAQVTSIMKDLYMLKKPYCVQFNRKNEIRPFEDVSSIEFLSAKTDASLFMFGSHSKKRPNNIVMGRLFDHHILDMIEFGVENYKSIEDEAFSEVLKSSVGSKPAFLFVGDAFTVREEFSKFSNILVDFYRGNILESMNLAGLEYVIVCTAITDKILFRTYKISLKKSSTKEPFVELQEMGPSMDFQIRRFKFASPDLMKFATRVPKEIKEVKQKNISSDSFSTKGKIHIQRQDLSILYSKAKKSKALRASYSSSSTAVSNGKEGDSSPLKRKNADEDNSTQESNSVVKRTKMETV